MSLLECLLCVSEKAANIARKCRADRHLFDLLVEEKKSDEANPRFIQDFKTLADVLIQQTVKHDVGKIFPELRENIRGEESNVFSNKLGETIIVDVLDSVEETANLLEKVLDGDKKAAELLSIEVHREINIGDINTNLPIKQELDDLKINYENCGVWIDPIDSTAEYISGKETGNVDGIYLNGLRCVTVLIGVYNRITGDPIMGVINQPFYTQEEEDTWIGKCFWGISFENKLIKSSLTQELQEETSNDKKIICLSSSESDLIKDKLRQEGFNLIEAAGAGYKLLSVITGKASAYILSKNSTFKWDTCGPQAVLKSQGGNIIVLSTSTINNLIPLNYFDNTEGNLKIEKCCNEGGFIAARNTKTIKEILELLN